MSVLRLRDVSHRFAAHWVLLHLDFELAAGARVLLLGDNGGGKTTLLRLCATVLSPTSGQLRLFAGRQPLRAARQRLALMTHQHHFYEALDATDNLTLIARLARPERCCAVAELLVRVGLSRAAARPVATYSAGMKRRLALARLLLLEPDLALLDEPFSQLDAQGVQLVEEVLDELAACGTTWVLATHDAARGARLATEVLHLAQGHGELRALPAEGRAHG